MSKHFPPFTKALGLAAILTLAIAVAAAPAWAGTITSPQVTFGQSSGFGMGNFNGGSGSLFGSGGSFAPSNFTLMDGADGPAGTPVPEPASWLLLAAGLGALGLAETAGRRRRAAAELARR